ncbi:LamG-like jellyroll fold domain-containing protein [Litoribacillus peritrichatus]|uniref:PKD domain-containing protein n=1 Tax=Litoribacillus peritrichatus TaxID=718191 RepID=A0ABP7N4N4_9GAMM
MNIVTKLVIPLLVLVNYHSFTLASVPERVEVTTSNSVGVAPLGVHFDVSAIVLNGETLNPIRDVSYRWSFDDDSGDRWSTNQKSKNTAQGFIAAHLYETPGTYEATVQISSLDGYFEPVERKTTITVLDPELVYGGENTVCFSMEGNFEGCPLGAEQVTLTTDKDAIINLREEGYFSGESTKHYRVWNTYKEYVLGYEHSNSFEKVEYKESWNCQNEALEYSEQLISAKQIEGYAQGAKRLLFARNETFLLYDSLALNRANGSSLGAYKACELSEYGLCSNAPELSFIAKSSQTDMLIIDDQSDSSSENTDLRVSDLSFSRICGFKNRAINLYDNVSQVVFNRLNITQLDSAIVGRTYGQVKPHDVIGMFNSKLWKLGPVSDTQFNPEKCQIRSLPLWHTGDGKTAIDSKLWKKEWEQYRSDVAALKSDPDCLGGGTNIAYLPAHRHMFLGNHMFDAVTKQAEHILRVPLAHKSIFSDNVFDHPSPNKHALKLHNMGDCVLINDCHLNPVQSAENYPTSWVLIRDNLFKADTDIVVNIGPGTSKKGERVNNILFESNRVEASSSANQVALNVSAFDSVVRNNVFLQPFEEDEVNGRTDWAAVVMGQARNEPDHAKGNQVVGNTVDVNGSSSLVRLYTQTDDARITDNQVCAPEEPRFVDLRDPSVSYHAENNLWSCVQPLVHLAFEDEENLSSDSENYTSGSVHGGVESVSGAVGKGVAFNGVGQEIILTDPMNTVESTGAFTIMTWLNVSDFLTQGEAFGRPRLNRQGDVSLGFDAEGDAMIYLNSLHVVPGIRLVENEWNQLAITFSREHKLVQVFLNGSLVHSQVFSENTDLNFDTGQEFRLGVGQWRSGSKHFSGKLDEFRIFDQALSPELINLQYRAEQLFF